ncbi:MULTISPECIES: toxin Cry1Ac domain D-VI-related protein [Listeria]|uniref:toxin Cry1Ac domain D-VI-related protein n=1 Tax=Listeria TaxID=1637 RepID=UPI000B595B43|nr:MULTISPECIES: toxin Cry1Ac domain D-VI-related protein [Listeria]
MKMMKKKKIIIVVLGVLILSVGIGIFVSYQEKVKAEEAKQEELQKLNAEMNTVQKELNSFYTDDSKEFIKDNITLDQIDKLTKKKSFENAEIDSEIKTVKKMIVLRGEVATLLDDKQALSGTADIEKAEQLARGLKIDKEAFVNEQFKVINEAKAQEKQIQIATDKVNQLFTTADKKEVKSEVTWDNYVAVKNEVDKIKQSKSKSELMSYLVKVSDELKKQDEEKVKKEAEQKQQQQNSQVKSNSSQPKNSASSDSGGKARNYQSNNSASSSSSGNSGNTSSNPSSSGNAKTPKSSDGGSSSNRSSSSGNSSSSSSGSKNYDTSKEGINDTTKNQNGGTDISWGWD